MNPDEFTLDRFLTAQASGSGIDTALAELRRGRKVSHWMWWIFPQIAGLGYSETSRFYAISSLAEAKAFLNHPVLGARLLEATTVVLGLEPRSAVSIFGSIDAQKLHSSMTLFLQAAEKDAIATSGSVFQRVLDEFFDGRPDEVTDNLL
jgi:uncharacterized protein (DUF1810 family)